MRGSSVVGDLYSLCGFRMLAMHWRNFCESSIDSNLMQIVSVSRLMMWLSSPKAAVLVVLSMAYCSRAIFGASAKNMNKIRIKEGHLKIQRSQNKVFRVFLVNL